MSNLKLREVRWFAQSRGWMRMGRVRAGSTWASTGYGSRTCAAQQSHFPCCPPCPPELSWRCTWWPPASESFYLLLGLPLRRPPCRERGFMRQRTGTPTSLQPFLFSLWVMWPPQDQRGGMSLPPSLIHPLVPVRIVYALATIIGSCGASQLICILKRRCSFLLSW